MSKLVSKEAFQLVHWEGALGGGGKRENRAEEQRAERECGAGLVPMLKRWMMQVQAWFIIGRQRGRATKLQTARPRLTSASPAFFSLILATSLSATSSVAPVDVPKKTPVASREVLDFGVLVCLEVETRKEGAVLKEGEKAATGTTTRAETSSFIVAVEVEREV